MSRPRSSAGAECVSAPDRDDIDPGLRDRADGRERHAARCLDARATADLRDARMQVVEREVVEHDRVDPRREHRLDLIEPIDLHLDVGRVRQHRDRLTEGIRDGEPRLQEDREVVVLDEHGVREREAVVAAAAAHDGVTFEGAQSRCRLARVHDPRLRVGDEGDVLRREGRDARHPLREVQADPLARQDGARRAGHGRERLSGRERVAVGAVERDLDARIGEPEGGGEDLGPREDALLARREHGVCDRGLRHERLAREVAPGGILDEGGGDDAVDLGPGQHGAPARLAAGERRPPIGSSRR